jgi:signal transduction histidine kinase
VTRLSLRGRILSGAVLWSVGLFVAAMVIATWLMVRYRVLALHIHGVADTHGLLFGIVVVALLLLGLRQVRRALSPLDRLRKRLAAIHDGTESRVTGQYPSEIQPLVDGLNLLLAQRDQAVRRAIAKAGDLAHGLKTPLAVLTQEAERARAAGQQELADSLDEQIGRMRRQLDYHLAHARAAASGASAGTVASVRESAEGLVRTLARLHAARGLKMDVVVDPAHAVMVQREDLDEMLGNLMDNACKWTRSRVTVSSTAAGGVIAVAVEDDGPGVPAPQRDAVLQRGVRADEAAPGTGLGLAIVRDLAQLYGGSIELLDARAGGLCARLTLPAARQDRARG